MMVIKIFSDEDKAIRLQLKEIDWIVPAKEIKEVINKLLEYKQKYWNKPDY